MSDRAARLDAAFAALPLVAILRGLTPDEAVPVAARLVAAGFRLIEVPLNSPEPFLSIARIRTVVAADILVGAGTVTTPGEVAHLATIGADMVVAPHADPAVIAAAKAAKLISIPGVFTPTEAFAALAAGADALKIFPAELTSPTGMKALRAVLPKSVRLLPVGGIAPETMAPWIEAGASGFGLGSALYRPGMTPDDIGARADLFVTRWKAIARCGASFPAQLT